MGINPFTRMDGLTAFSRFWWTLRGRCWCCKQTRQGRHLYCDRSRFHNGGRGNLFVID